MQVADRNDAVTELHNRNKSRFCPTVAALTMLNGRWTPHIVHTMLCGQTRFNEMTREIGINPRTLRERLRELEEQGVVKRRVVSVMPPNVEYSLTEKGESLGEIFTALAKWGSLWMPPPAMQPESEEHRRRPRTRRINESN